MASSLQQVEKEAKIKKESVVKLDPEFGLAENPKLNAESQVTFIFTPFSTPHGFTRNLKFNKKSLWRDNEAFSSEEIKKISEDLIEQAQNQFKSLPKPVITQIMRVVMFSDDVDSDGHGPLPTNIECVPKVFIQYGKQRFYFHKDDTYKAFDFLATAIDRIETRKGVELRDKKFEAEKEKLAEDTFPLVQSDSNFLTAFNLYSMKNRVDKNPMNTRQYWKQQCRYVFGSDANTVVNKVASGQHRFNRFF